MARERHGAADADRFDTFFPFSRLFFQMSIPRFKYRLQFKDERRPSPAFLNAIVRASCAPPPYALMAPPLLPAPLRCSRRPTGGRSPERVQQRCNSAWMLSGRAARAPGGQKGRRPGWRADPFAPLVPVNRQQQPQLRLRRHRHPGTSRAVCMKRSARLTGQYLWATRFSGTENVELEERYYEAGRAAMFEQSTLPYRMLDQMRAGFLLSAYVYGGGRFHEVSPLRVDLGLLRSPSRLRPCQNAGGRVRGRGAVHQLQGRGGAD